MAATKKKQSLVFPSHVRQAVSKNPPDYTGELVRLLDDINTVSHGIAAYCRSGSEDSTYGDAGASRGRLDPEVATRHLFKALTHDGYACLIVEKNHDAPLAFPEDALYGLYIVTLSSLDTDFDVTEAPMCGTIFSVYKRTSLPSTPGKIKDIQQPLSAQVASGYIVYSSAVSLYYTVGNGTHSFVLQPVAKQYFHDPTEPMEFKIGCNDVYTDTATLYSGKYSALSRAVKDTIMNADPRGRIFDHNCFVASVHSAMTSGCLVVLFDTNLLCEAGPAAMICEQMGGKATDGKGKRILDMAVKEKLRENTTFVAGPAQLVDEVERRWSEIEGANGRDRKSVV